MTNFLIKNTPTPKITNATTPTIVGTINAKLLPVDGVTITVSAILSSRYAFAASFKVFIQDSTAFSSLRRISFLRKMFSGSQK